MVEDLVSIRSAKDVLELEYREANRILSGVAAATAHSSALLSESLRTISDLSNVRRVRRSFIDHAQLDPHCGTVYVVEMGTVVAGMAAWRSYPEPPERTRLDYWLRDVENPGVAAQIGCQIIKALSVEAVASTGRNSPREIDIFSNNTAEQASAEMAGFSPHVDPANPLSVPGRALLVPHLWEAGPLELAENPDKA